MGEPSLRDLFHMVKMALPDSQELVTVNASTEVQQALDLMITANISQVPIVASGEVLGVFSYRSLAQGILNLPKKEPFQPTLPVELFMEDLAFASITEEIGNLLDEFDIKDAVLVGSENHIHGVLTSIDALRYFQAIASPYFLLREIELAIRELIRISVTAEQLAECIDNSLKKHYEGRNLPTSLEEMTFNDYVMLLRFQGNWPHFEKAWGGTCNTVAAKLEPLPELRNVVFHFKRELEVEEHNTLKDRREWLLKRVRKVEADRKAGANA